MDISVDLPAPFSPTMPWIMPRSTRRLTFLLAWTGPKLLSTPISSMAGGAPVSFVTYPPPRARHGRACPGHDAKRPAPTRFTRRLVERHFLRLTRLPSTWMPGQAGHDAALAEPPHTGHLLSDM